MFGVVAGATIICGGFAWFVYHVPAEEVSLDRNADGIVVLTGGASRISDAIELLAAGRGKRLLISGVHRTTSTAEIARIMPRYEGLVACCVDLDHSAINTVGNAVETRRWARDRGFTSLIVVTSAYHMPRTMAELEKQMPDTVLVPFPVVTEKLRNEPWWASAPTARLILSEYAKFVVAQLRMRIEPVPGLTEQRAASGVRREELTAVLVAALGRLQSAVLSQSHSARDRRDPDLRAAAARCSWLMAKSWGRTSNWLLRVVAGIRVELRGLEKIPPGALLVAAKHQSVWETFTLFTLFDDPAYVLKRELMWIPVFGWYAWKSDMIPVDRASRGGAVAGMIARARAEFARGRQIIIFPEGTRTAPGAPPAYRQGVVHLYAQAGVPCLPIALNSGLFWPRRKFLRYPGTIVLEVLDPIPPGLAARGVRGAAGARDRDGDRSADRRGRRRRHERAGGLSAPRRTPRTACD